MKPLYALREKSVFYDGRKDLAHNEVQFAVTNAMRRKLRRAGYDATFWRELSENGESFITWHFTRYNARNDKEWVAFEALANTNTSYHLNCFGPKAEQTIERINKAAHRKLPGRIRKQLVQADRLRRKHRKKKKKNQKASEQLPKQKVRKEKKFVPLCLSQEQLVPQYRNSRVFWQEAAACVAYAFDMPGHNRLARSWVRLFDSAKRTEWRYAQYKGRGFTIRFEFADCRWRGDITPLTVSCTKDNRHPVYRRMRSFLAKKLQGLPPPVQNERRAQLYLPVETKIAA